MLTSNRLSKTAGQLHRKTDPLQFLTRDFRWFRAFRAEFPDKTLCKEGTDGRADKERFHAHINKTGNTADSIICVESTENKMSSLRRADGDLDGLAVTHLTDHHDIWISTQDTAQGAGKGQIDLRLHCDLNDPIDLVLHRIFDRDDAAFLDIESTEEGVKRGALSATGWAGYQHNAIRHGNQ